MNAYTIKFVVSYLLLPLIGIILAFIAVVIAKKNKIASNKHLIAYILLSAIIITIPALLGFIDYAFMPYWYICLQIFYLFLGVLNMKVSQYNFPKLEEKPFYMQFGFSFVIVFIGAAFFSMVFNMFNELQYGLWACTCTLTFLFPPLFKQTLDKYMDIPTEIYKIWRYSDKDLPIFESIDYNKLMVIEVEIYKNVGDTNPTKIKAKTPDNITYGMWFQKFLHDYNLKFPTAPIQTNDGSKAFGWIFYYKQSFFHFRKYIDPDQTIVENKIQEKFIIVAKRVQEDYTYI